MKPHAHAEVIKAWADGAEIEVQTPSSPTTFTDWHRVTYPTWDSGYRYRVKPREFPKSSKDGAYWWEVYRAAVSAVRESVSPHMICVKVVADEAIKQYILDQEAAGVSTS